MELSYSLLNSLADSAQAALKGGNNKAQGVALGYITIPLQAGSSVAPACIIHIF